MWQASSSLCTGSKVSSSRIRGTLEKELTKSKALERKTGVRPSVVVEKGDRDDDRGSAWENQRVRSRGLLHSTYEEDGELLE